MPGGRPAKPTALKVVQGTARRDRLNANEPQYGRLEVMAAPEWLDETGRAHWDYHAPMLARQGVLTEVDVSLLAAASERWSVYTRAAMALHDGLTRDSNTNGTTAKAEANIARGALQDYQRLMVEFGVGPASRSKVQGVAAQEVDPFDTLLGGKRA